jgi:hypothetical protein
MVHWKAHSIALLAALAPLVPACSSDESGDDDSERGGSNAGGTAGSQGGAGGASGTAGLGGGTPLVDCAGLCNRVRMTCEGQSTIDETWVDVCTRACEIRVEVASETALLEKACIEGTTDCTTAILCVSMPTGTGGSSG